MINDKNFKFAVKKTLFFEGGYVNHPHDPGGETNFGISKRSYPHLDIKNLTKEQAKEIYYRDFWLRNRCDAMLDKHIASKVFDFSVNMGLIQGGRILQRALRANEQSLVEDGIIGPITLAATNSFTGANHLRLMSGLRSEAAGFYRSLVAQNANNRVFLTGWLNRAYA